MKVYGAPICINCVEAKEILDSKNLEYTYVDITQSVSNMKEFLRLRDSREEFSEVKERGKIGIPTFLFTDGRISLDINELDIEDIKKDREIEKENQPGLCGFDGC